ncbi:MAG: hypothetical protein ACXVH1_18325 [Solirubrobacteraceae bacterium]
MGWLTLPTFGADDSQVWAEAVALQARAKQANERLRALLNVPPPEQDDDTEQEG